MPGRWASPSSPWTCRLQGPHVPEGPLSLSRWQELTPLPEIIWSWEMNTQQRIDRLEDAVANLGTIIEAEGRWAESQDPNLGTFGERFSPFVLAVARERAAKS
jgi:hypothetical protein